MIVLDASVALKWFFWDEAGWERARHYRNKHVSGDEIIAVPDLFFYEVANVLSNRTTLSVEAMSEAFSLLWSFDFEVFSLGLGEFLGGITLSERYRVNLYDAAYLELARRLKCEFVTFDKKLYEKVKGLKMVKLL
jgi:predicted nucleic acid-binding protein